jgi:ArsR family transcriptional regulator
MGARAELDTEAPALIFKALGDSTRLRIFALLCQAELCVCHIESALDLPQPTVSRHLAILRNAGVVEARRQGTWIFYRLARQENPLVQRQLRGLVQSLSSDNATKEQVRRLLVAKGPTACL